MKPSLGIRRCALATLGALVLAPTLATAATGLPWSSSFENGGFGEWNASRRGELAIQRTNAADGNYAIRAPMVAGSLNDNYLEHHFGDHFRTRLDKVEEVYLQFDSRFEDGYRFPSSKEHKLAIFNLTNGVDSQRRYQVYISVDAEGRYQVTHSDIATWRFETARQNQGAEAYVRYGQWDKITLRVKLNTPGRADGIIQLWVNGELKLSHSNRNIRHGDDFGLNKLILSSYTTGQNGGNGVQWWDNWLLQETDPRPAEPDRNPPSPPVLRSID